MPTVNIGELVIDVPADRIDAVQDFYGALTGYKVWRNEESNPMLENADGMDLGLQRVIEGYEAPTWPSQERGQQIHIDFATPDFEAAVSFAESIGAIRAAEQPADDKADDEFVVMLDPVGHPFCFVPHHEPWLGPVVKREDGAPPISMRMPFLDCPDHRVLAAFYTDLLDGSPLGEANDEYVAIRAANGVALGFQRVEGYQAPTWPTQERGQQMHIDMRVADLDEARVFAESLGATVGFVPPSEAQYLVMLDPAGHPFCLGHGGQD